MAKIQLILGNTKEFIVLFHDINNIICLIKIVTEQMNEALADK